MGIDAEIVCLDEVTDEEIVKANRFIEDRGWPMSWSYRDWDDQPVVERRYGVVDFTCAGQRYYGPGYERGQWHVIASGIMLACGALPGHEIRYGGDSNAPVNFEVVTPEFMQRMWDYYLFSPDALAYRQPRSS